MNTSLIINATNGSQKVTKAITNINPEKDNAVLKTFAQKVNDLTTNTYVDATRITKESVEEEHSGGSTGELTFTVNDDNYEGSEPIGPLVPIERGVRIWFGVEGLDKEEGTYTGGYIDLT